MPEFGEGGKAIFQLIGKNIGKEKTNVCFAKEEAIKMIRPLDAREDFISLPEAFCEEKKKIILTL